MKSLRQILGFIAALFTFAVTLGVQVVSCSSIHVNFESKEGGAILLLVLVPISFWLALAAYRGISRNNRRGGNPNA